MKRMFAGIVVAAILVTALGCTASQPEAVAPMPTFAPAAEPREMPAGEEAFEAADGELGVTTGVLEDRRIIYRANMSLVVLDTQESMQDVQELVASNGGYVASSELSQYRNELLRGFMTVRVPVENYEATLAALRALAVRVTSESSNTEDVTAEFVDLEARLRNLEAAERELVALLEEVRERPNATAEDILEVFDAVTAKRGEIEQVKGRMQYLSNLTALSTISIELVPDDITRPVVEEGWQPLVTLKGAFRSLVNILQGLVDFLINVVVVVLPVAIIVLVPILALIFLVRWLVRRRQARSTGE